MKGYFMYGIVVSYETYLNSKTGNIIEEHIINTEDVQGIFTRRDSEFVIVGRVLNEITPETEEPHEIPVMGKQDEQLIIADVKQRFGITGETHYYFITR